MRGQMRVDILLFLLPPSKCHPEVNGYQAFKRGDNLDR